MTAVPEMALFVNPRARRPPASPPDTTFAAPEAVAMVGAFHRTLPTYQPTPLVRLGELARQLGLEGLWVKDEARRFGLKAFKGLGASFAICATLAKRLGLPPPLDFRCFDTPAVRRFLSGLTVVAASDGNHGIAVAWMASQLGGRSRILLPAGTAESRQRAVRAVGGQPVVINGNYDEAVRQAVRQAQRPDTLLIQDTAWEGYQEIPRRVMQGYLTLFEEAFAQLGDTAPTHLFVPCGVGSLAASLQAYLIEALGERRPRLVVVESAAADCYYRSMIGGGQTIVPVTGPMETRMAGLACGEPTRAGWNILRHYADVFVRCSDAVAVAGVQRLAHPLGKDPVVESGECGAVTLGLLRLLMAPNHAREREMLGLGPRSRVLLFSTEGATDPDSYRQAVDERPAVAPPGRRHGLAEGRQH